MNAQEADNILDSCSDVFKSFSQSHALRLKRNDHFEGVNRAFEWSEGGILKVIDVEFTYTDKPRFEIFVKAFNRIGLVLHRYGGILRFVVPLRQWYRHHTGVELPKDKAKLIDILEKAYQELVAVDSTSLSVKKK